jgi:hypothetical protein
MKIGPLAGFYSLFVRRDGSDAAYNSPGMVKSFFEETLIDVWRQALVENARHIVLGTERYSVRQTPKRGLRQVDFMFEGNEIRGLEQNPETNTRWGQMARSGKKVMQFLSEGRYLANVADGNVTLYGIRTGESN